MLWEISSAVDNIGCHTRLLGSKCHDRWGSRVEWSALPPLLAVLTPQQGRASRHATRFRMGHPASNQSHLYDGPPSPSIRGFSTASEGHRTQLRAGLSDGLGEC